VEYERNGRGRKDLGVKGEKDRKIVAAGMKETQESYWRSCASARI